MDKPTDATTPPANRSRRCDAALFARYHPPLLRSVRHIVNTSAENVADACAFAWLQLLRTQPEQGDTLFAWLRTTAVREAIRLDRGSRSTDELSDQLTDRALAAAGSLDDSVAVRDALHALADLPPRQARMIALHVAGYSYDEIAHHTRASRRTVERQLLRGKQRLREGRVAG